MATVRMSVAFYYIQSDLPKRTSGCHVADLFGAPADHYGRIDTQLQSRLLDISPLVISPDISPGGKFPLSFYGRPIGYFPLHYHNPPTKRGLSRYTQSRSSVNRVYESKATTPKTTEQNQIVRTGKSEAEVANKKKLRSRYCTIEANY